MGLLDKLRRLFKHGELEAEKEKIRAEKEKLTEEELRQNVPLPGTEHLEALEDVTKSEEEEVRRMEEEEVKKAGEILAHKEIKPKLYPSDPVIKAPEIGIKTAKYLQEAGIVTIEELLKTPIREIQRRLAQIGKRVYRATIYRWKVETRLMLEIPILRIRDVKYLYEIRIRSRQELLKYTPDEIYKRIQNFLNTKEGTYLAERYEPPTLEDIKKWFEIAEKAKESIPEYEIAI